MNASAKEQSHGVSKAHTTGDKRPRLWRRLLLRRIGIRFLTLHLLLLFLPIGGLIVFDRYEQQLLQEQEEALVQQARLLVALLEEPGTTARTEGSIVAQLEQRSRSILVRFAGSNLARLRVLDASGELIADSSALGHATQANPAPATPTTSSLPTNPRPEEGASLSNQRNSTRERLLYRIGAFPFRALRGPLGGSSTRRRYGAEPPPFAQRSEVQAALAGSYGARARTDGDRLVLHSALPILLPAGSSSGSPESSSTNTSATDHRIGGVVLVSKSTDRIRARVYELRLFLFKIFLSSVVLAIIVNLLLAGTIERPLRQLRLEAAGLIDSRGRLLGEFTETQRIDEIGDLTRSLRTLATRLKHQQRRTEEFVADLSHELKNPLATIRTATDLDSYGDSKRGKEITLRSVARMERLISELAELSRIEAGVAPSPSAIDIGAVVHEAVTAWAHNAERRIQLLIFNKALTLDPGAPHQALPTDAPVHPDTSLPTLPFRIDPDHVVRILENLLDNAAAHSPSHTELDVTLQNKGKMIMLSVRDRGTGIKKGDEQRIFQRFYSRRRTPQTGQLSPQGLGLAVVRALAEAHGGRARARTLSPNEGDGALFEVELLGPPF